MKTSVRIGLVLLSILLAGETRAACTVSTTPLSFGPYDVFSAFPRDATATITVTCDELPPADVTISIGRSPNAGGYFPRKMKHVSRPDLLNYNVYTGPSMGAVWGDGTGGTQTVFLRNVQRNRPPRVTTVYGRIPAGQDVSVGAYAETLTVTIVP